MCRFFVVVIVKSEEINKIEGKYLKNLSLISSIMLRKLRLKGKNGFLIKKRVWYSMRF